METRRYAAIRLAASTTSLSQELSRMVRNAREENTRRGGWVRIFPTADTWPMYSSMLEYSSPNNQILHEHLFPEAARKQVLRATYRKPKPINSSKSEIRKRSQSAGPGRDRVGGTSSGKEDQEEKAAKGNKVVVDEGIESGEAESIASCEVSRPLTSSGAVISTSSSSSLSSSGIGSTNSNSSSGEEEQASDVTAPVPTPAGPPPGKLLKS
jgi:hypothetical protein